MSDLFIIEKINALRAELKEHNYLYYVKAEPVISDYEFDIKLKELEALESKYPDFFDEDSPTQKVGGKVNKSFQTIAHEKPMLSLGNTYNEEEIREFDQRVYKLLGTENYEYTCELKIDGLAISLIYENKELSRALTRGNGLEGDDVTENVKTIKSLITKLPSNAPQKIEFRGEIFMHRKAFEKLNEKRTLAGEATYANPRNVAAGSLKLLDSSEVAKRPLDIYLYHVICDNKDFHSHYESLIEAQKWGIKISEYTKKCKNIDEVLEYIKEWDSKKKKLSFDIDGVVIKVNNFDQQNELGFTAKVPRWAISYKYQTEAALTQLLSVDFQVGRTGAITPVANLAPVLLLGTTVKRASLHNANEIERLDLHSKDWVYIEKGGEIIPKITGIEKSKRDVNAELISMPILCPECHSTLIRNDGEANHYCPNYNACPPQIVGKFQHFISKKAMNIDGIGEETIEQLHKHGLIKQLQDLYKLRFEELVCLERMAEKSVLNILEGIESSKQISFSRVLFALGIRFVGETVAKKLSKHFKSIDKLMIASYEDLCKVDEIGDRIASSVIDYFSKEENIHTINELKNAGLQFEIETKEEDIPSSEILRSKTVVISGTFNLLTRDQIKDLVESNGGKNGSGVTSKTDYLVAGENMGPAKLQKANELGIKILSEEEFLALIHFLPKP